ncbi:ATP-dependent nuclease [Burkholderia gladioli]|uniref:ATP-dependent nuclease n=1 Tax=Burkholderia gladioli TaxID=28095 RepID=UPI00164184D1|nr:AAA family ATPase [Burkholderia gladioli]MDC6130734.1 AAA family ATPase [Burkholderia gladioli]MDN7804873.1 AAA family ATPase [Burkholderia gladioli]
MKLTKVQIHNFRAIHDATFVMKSYGLLVGANNAGKSSVIDAIRAFYEKDGYKFKAGTDFPHVKPKDAESWIDLTFSLTKDEFASLADDYKFADGVLRVRKYFSTELKMHDGKSATGAIFGYKVDGTISDEPFYGAKNVQSGKFGDLIYIPAISKVDEHAKLSGPSALRDLLSDIMSDVVEGGAAYAEFSKNVKAFSDAVRDEKTADDRSLSGFEAELNEMLKPWDSAFQLKFPAPTAPEIVKSMLGWDLLDLFHGKEQGIDYYGSGFQRHFIYSLIQLGARYTGKKAGKKVKDFSPSLNLVLFEEPEAFLHPPQQEVLARNLALVAEAENWQVLVATHSANFVSKNAQDIPAITRLCRKGGITCTYQIDEAAWDELIDANQVIAEIAKKYPKMEKRLHADDARPEMEAVKHFLWLNPDRSAIFFANHVLLVEGATEVALINRLVGLGKVSGADCGVYVLDCLGKYNIHRFMNLLSRLGISHSVIHDDDNNKGEHGDLNKLIVDSADANFTKSIIPVAGDVETLLDIPKAGSDHRKPQHVLFLLETSQIAEEKLSAFCQVVEKSLVS